MIRVSVGKERPYRGEHNRITMGLRSDEGRYTWLGTSVGPSAFCLPRSISCCWRRSPSSTGWLRMYHHSRFGNLPMSWTDSEVVN
jgi:hypothetical protein